jgi:hypothetical protein
MNIRLNNNFKKLSSKKITLMIIATKIRRREDFDYLMNLCVSKNLTTCSEYFSNQEWQTFPYFTYDEGANTSPKIYGCGHIEFGIEERSLGRFIDEINSIIVSKTVHLCNEVSVKAFQNGQVVQVIVDGYPYQITVEKWKEANRIINELI